MKLILITLLIGLCAVGGAIFYKNTQSIEPVPVVVEPVPLSVPDVPVLTTAYITPVEWPPVSEVKQVPYVCTETEVRGDAMEETTKRVINGREWCRATTAEGAAGSTYVSYRYTSAEGTAVREVAFVLREVQCGNYDEPKQSECLNERVTFDPDSVISMLGS